MACTSACVRYAKNAKTEAVLCHLALGPFDKADKRAGQKSDRAAIQFIAGRDDRRAEPGAKRLEQLSQESKISPQTHPQAQRICPRAATNIPEAEVQRSIEGHRRVHGNLPVRLGLYQFG